MLEKSSGTLVITLPSDREIAMSRVFDAPRDLVFEAWSKPEHVKNWWGMRGSTMIVCEMDFRPGGAWRYVLLEADGQEFPFRGVYREIVRPELLSYTFIYDVEPYSKHEAIETIIFNEEDGRTTLICTTIYDSVEARDGILNSGMEEGANQIYDRLAEYLETMG